MPAEEWLHVAVVVDASPIFHLRRDEGVAGSRAFATTVGRLQVVEDVFFVPNQQWRSPVTAPALGRKHLNPSRVQAKPQRMCLRWNAVQISRASGIFISNRRTLQRQLNGFTASLRDIGNAANVTFPLPDVHRMPEPCRRTQHKFSPFSHRMRQFTVDRRTPPSSFRGPALPCRQA